VKKLLLLFESKYLRFLLFPAHPTGGLVMFVSNIPINVLNV